MKIIRILPPACLLALLAGVIFAQGSQTYCDIEGVVLGSDHQPVGNVMITLQSSFGAQVARTVTSTDGRYTFSRVVPGNYLIEASPNEKLFRRAVSGAVCNEPLRTGRDAFIAQPVRVPDIMLSPAPRPVTATPGTVFAQNVPPAAEAEYKQAEENRAKGKKPEAIAHLNRALEIFPNYFLAAQTLGLTYLELEQYRQAVVPLQKAININPKAAPSYLGMGIALVNLDRAEVALEALKEARALDPGAWRVQLYSGVALLNLGRFDEAEKALKAAYASGGAGEASSAHLYLASVYEKSQRYREAISELETYLKESPKAASADNIRKVIKNLRAKL
jgi:Flp pilus assembly protein TadD